MTLAEINKVHGVWARRSRGFVYISDGYLRQTFKSRGLPWCVAKWGGKGRKNVQQLLGIKRVGDRFGP